MSQSRTIKDYFKRPPYPLRSDEHTSSDPKTSSEPDHIPVARQLSSSPLSDPPSSLPSQITLSQSVESDTGLQLKASWINAATDFTQHDPGYLSFRSSTELHRSSSVGGSFNSSQRIIKNGKELVTGSDGEDTDSIDSLESPEELLKMFMKPSSTQIQRKDVPLRNTNLVKSPRPFQTSQRNKIDGMFMPQVARPKYKFTIEDLVTHAVDDDEAEAGAAKARAALGSRKGTPNGTGLRDNSKSASIREDVLTSAFSEESEETNLQRLLDAVRRTEAFDQEKSWRFFSDQAPTPLTPGFPRDSILPSSREAFLREPISRERAFHSGVLELALSKNLLPDELIIWILYSVPSEPRDDLRSAYCKVLKRSSPQRLASLVRPEDIDQVFQSLGATSAALGLSKEVIPEPTRSHLNRSYESKYLLSVLELLRDVADLLCDDTREHTIQILFRLALDTSLTRESMILPTLESAIDGLLQQVSDVMIRRIFTSTFDTIQDVVLQSHLMKHVLPTSPWIALWRCRLAMAFFIRDPSPLTEPPGTVLNIRRITHHLRDKRFDVKLYKDRRESDYNYSELGATTSLLNIVIDLDRLTPTFRDKQAENDFNADVDALAERIKRIFSAIEDSGASHLKRTETKQSLEALHYRIVYSVRSKPPPKKSFFGVDGPDDWDGISRSGSFMNKFLSAKRENTWDRDSLNNT